MVNKKKLLSIGEKMCFVTWVFLVIILFVLIGLMMFKNFFYPAYISTKNGCNLMTDSEVAELGYVMSGSYNPKTKEIKVFNYSEENITVGKNMLSGFVLPKPSNSTLKHEYCHKRQDTPGGYFNKSRLASCDQQVIRYINELECYFVSYF